MSKERVPGSHLSWWRLDCLAGVRGLELRNVVANYPFESSRGFPGCEPDSGHGDHSRLSCSAAATDFAAGRLRCICRLSAARKAHERDKRATETRLRGWACRTRTQKCRRKLSL